MAGEANPPAISEEKEGKLLVVILVGAPGSGKTTFCNDVMSAAQRKWTRICQDTIANGKAGTKSQCLQSAIIALKDCKNILIDRCNLELEQRSEFVKLGGAQVDVHAVVLDLPARVCISRSVKRTGHEGNLQGGKAAVVVNRMLQKRILPKLNEGFSRIMFCQNEIDVKNAVDTYCSLGPFDSLPSGVIGQKSMDAKVQQGIMKFLKKVDSNEIESQKSIVKHEFSENNHSAGKIIKRIEVGKDKQGDDLLQNPCTSDFRWDGAPTLAFPSISTSDFQFNQEKASDVIVETVADFLCKFDNVKLILVDLSPKSNMLSLVKVKASKKMVDSNRFSTYSGDITRLYTEGGLQCNVIANTTNWRLKPGGGGVNAAIFSAGGEALEIATKEQAEAISPGSSVLVPVPNTSVLYQREGVTHVIHVLGPNMNPQRPNCLKDDYVKGCNILRDAYTSLFDNFVSITRIQKYQIECGRDSNPGPSESVNKFFEAIVEHTSKRESIPDSDSNKRSKSNENLGSLTHGPNILEIEKQKNERTDHPVKRSWGSWAQALHQVAMHPEKHEGDVIEITDDYVVINDVYPKAKKHILVISRLPGLDCLSVIRRESLPMLKKMHDVGLKWAEKFSSHEPSLEFRLGYHSVPSMRQLHLHVISQDFDSTHLRNKKHWNSFNTLFFRDSIDALDEIEKNGLATIKDEKLLSSELRCHRCKSAHPNIPKLKSHIATCKAPFPSHLQNGQLVFALSSKTVIAT